MLPPIANRFVAGETAATAIDHTRRTNDDGVGVILNLLGEHHTERATADADAAAYRSLLAELDGLRACVSVKPSQLGLDVDEAVFVENYRSVVTTAIEHGRFVWCDMEDSSTTDATLDAVEAAAVDHPWQVGVCLQANLRRTRDDIARLADVPCAIRLVKGAYDEPGAIAYTERSAVDDAYRADLELLFERRERGVAVGSHDPSMITLAKTLHDEHDTDFEIQMLMGVREDAQQTLAADGYEVWQYAPYGERWLAYFYRRLRERKSNAIFAARAILGG